MSQQPIPYVSANPGDPITAEAWNGMQIQIKEDIETKVDDAIQAIERVKMAGDAEKLAGKSLDEVTQAIIDQVLAEIPKRTGYLALFKELKLGEEVVIEHNLKAFPLVDVYQLDYFEVIASEDDQKYRTWTTFYLYHSSESRIRFKEESGLSTTGVSIAIEPGEGHAFRIPFKDMLDMYKVQYYDDSSLDDLETEFWKAFLAPPNDKFDDTQYTRSPWFDRCCMDHKQVRSLRRDWNDIWFQVRPRKTVHYPTADAAETDEPTIAPSQIGVMHFDLNTMGIKLLAPPVLPDEQLVSGEGGAGTPIAPVRPDHLKVMLLLKV